MQTFLPYANFGGSANVLDMRRLGKQRIEGVTLLRSLVMQEGKWLLHPCAKMWSGYEIALSVYTLTMCETWQSRGYKDTMAERVMVWAAEVDYSLPIEALNQETLEMEGLLPSWLGDEQFHLSHRSNLIRKNPAAYGHIWPDVPSDLPYVWPEPSGATS